MEYTKVVDGKKCTFNIRGKFTFSDHEKFRDVVNVIKKTDVENVILELSEVEFIDSAALGMLLVAREESVKKSKNLILEKPSEQLIKMFKVSKFDSIFDIKW